MTAVSFEQQSYVACSFSFVKRLLKRYKDTGKIEPKPYAGGHNNRINGVGGVQELEFNSMP
jgi:transposase